MDLSPDPPQMIQISSFFSSLNRYSQNQPLVFHGSKRTSQDPSKVGAVVASRLTPAGKAGIRTKDDDFLGLEEVWYMNDIDIFLEPCNPESNLVYMHI